MINNRKGFTLIELLVVIAIIAILAGIVIVSVSGARKKANDAKVKADVAAVMRAAEINLEEKGSFTSNSAVAVALDDAIAKSFVDDTGAKVLNKAPIYPGQSSNDTTNGYTWRTDAASDSTKYMITGKLSDGTFYCGSAGATFSAADCGAPQ